MVGQLHTMMRMKTMAKKKSIKTDHQKVKEGIQGLMQQAQRKINKRQSDLFDNSNLQQQPSSTTNKLFSFIPADKRRSLNDGKICTTNDIN